MGESRANVDDIGLYRCSQLRCLWHWTQTWVIV